MFLGNLSETDKTIARGVRWCALAILGGLTLTGIWQFFFHAPDTAWDRYQLGTDRYLLSTASTGIAEVHAAFADLAGLLSLCVVAWVSARVLHRVSWLAIGALVVVIWGLYTGTLIRFNTTFEDGAVVTSDSGYSQFFLGQADGVVTDRFELGQGAIVAWTIAHIISVPVLVAAASFTLKRSEIRREQRKGHRRSWLDELPRPAPAPPLAAGPHRQPVSVSAPGSTTTLSRLTASRSHVESMPTSDLPTEQRGTESEASDPVVPTSRRRLRRAQSPKLPIVPDIVSPEGPEVDLI